MTIAPPRTPALAPRPSRFRAVRSAVETISVRSRPFLTTALVGTSHFMQAWWWLIGLALFGAFSAFRAYGRSESGRLMLDKLSCEPAIRWWSIPLPGDQKAMSADRNVYGILQESGPPGEVSGPTVFYAMQSDDIIHAQRVSIMGELYDKAGGGSVPERASENA